MSGKYLDLAKLSLDTYIQTKSIIEIPSGLPDEMMNEKAGAFVSLHIKGTLRGCIGTIFPVQDCLANEIIHNAISAGTRDPRFCKVSSEELELLEYSVDVMGLPEKIEGLNQLDVKKYGLIVSKGHKVGLLLPDLKGVNTPKQQVKIALQKAGIDLNENYYMERFKVTRYGIK